MEEFEDFDKGIAYSRSVKAGKRIYYLDVKRSRNDELYLSLTESKKKTTGNPDNPDVSFEKHKIFLYPEDFSKFTEALIDVIRFIKDHKPVPSASHPEDTRFEDTGLEAAEASGIDDTEPPIRLDLTDFE